MLIRCKVSTVIAPVLTLTLMLPTVTQAQTLWISPSQEATVSLETVKPFFKSEFVADPSFFSSAINFNVRLPVNDYAIVALEIPFSYFNEKDSNLDNTLSIGNPYLGVEAHSSNDLFFGEVGVRFPLVGDESNGVVSGLLGDLGRFDAYLPDRWCFAGFGNLQYRAEHGSGLLLRLRFGPVLSVYSGDLDIDDKTELFLAYGGQIWYTRDRITGAIGLFARSWVSESDVENPTVEHMGLSLTVDAGVVRPGVQVRIPLDENFRDVTGLGIGLHLTVPVSGM